MSDNCIQGRTNSYKKKEIVITTKAGATFTVTDTDDCKLASMALAEFRRGGIMHFFVDDDDYFVPASAVDSIKVTLADAESE